MLQTAGIILHPVFSIASPCPSDVLGLDAQRSMLRVSEEAKTACPTCPCSGEQKDGVFCWLDMARLVVWHLQQVQARKLMKKGTHHLLSVHPRLKPI